MMTQTPYVSVPRWLISSGVMITPAAAVATVRAYSLRTLRRYLRGSVGRFSSFVTPLRVEDAPSVATQRVRSRRLGWEHLVRTAGWQLVVAAACARSRIVNEAQGDADDDREAILLEDRLE